MINLNPDFEIQDMMDSFSESIFFDLNNRGNFIIEPLIKDANDLVELFFKLISIKSDETKIKYDLKKSDNDSSKKLFIFDIQSASNEKSIDVLLKNLNLINNITLEIIWRAGSIDFNYYHLDVENFLQYYQAIMKADMFFTDDKIFADFLYELGCDFIFLGKNSPNEEIKTFSPKNIFDLKNHILEFINRKRIV